MWIRSIRLSYEAQWSVACAIITDTFNNVQISFCLSTITDSANLVGELICQIARVRVIFRNGSVAVIVYDLHRPLQEEFQVRPGKNWYLDLEFRL